MTRVLPEPDRFATCPTDGRVLDYYAGVFDAVYVTLSPFIRPVGISPDLFYPETYPERATIIASCEPVKWADVAAGAGLFSLAEVNNALLRMKDTSRPPITERLEAFCEKNGIVPPNDGEHPDLLHNKVLSLLQAVGYEWVWVGDEFCTERKLHWIEDLKNEEELTITGHCNVFTPDKRLLWTVHWDSYFTLLCSSNQLLSSILIDESLEGFFCTAETSVDWSRKPQ